MRKLHNIRRGGYGLLCLSLLLFLGSCAVNPVTGRQELMLLTEEEEVQLGRQTDAQIVKQYRLYPDPKLTGYLDPMGQRLAKASHRAELPFHFKDSGLGGGQRLCRSRRICLYDPGHFGQPEQRGRTGRGRGARNRPYCGPPLGPAVQPGPVRADGPGFRGVGRCRPFRVIGALSRSRPDRAWGCFF